MWRLELPYPPAINKRLGAFHVPHSKKSKAYLISKKVFKHEVWINFVQSKLPSWGKKMIKLTVEIYCPDKRHRDADGVIKELFDSLQYAGCLDDDYQIQKYTVERKDEVETNGKVIVTIEPIDQTSSPNS